MKLREALELKIEKVQDNVLKSVDTMLEDDQRRSPMSVPEIRAQRVLLLKLQAMYKQLCHE